MILWHWGQSYLQDSSTHPCRYFLTEISAIRTESEGKSEELELCSRLQLWVHVPLTPYLSITQIRIPTQMGPGCHLALLTRTYLLSEVMVLLAKK